MKETAAGLSHPMVILQIPAEARVKRAAPSCKMDVCLQITAPFDNLVEPIHKKSHYQINTNEDGRSYLFMGIMPWFSDDSHRKNPEIVYILNQL